MSRYWIGLDQGSTATKACLVDRRGRLIRSVSIPIKTYFPRTLQVEHDADQLFRSVQSALRRITRDLDPAPIGAIGLSCQRSTFLFWDPETGRPLSPALSWQDRRAEAICRSLAAHDRSIRARTGLRLSPHYAASKIRWLLDRSPSLRKRLAKGRARVGTLDSFLLFRLTRGGEHATDPTHAARTLLMNLGRQRWDRDLLERFDIPTEALPCILPSASIRGEIRIRGTAIPVAASLGDQQAALVGLGCLRRGEGGVNYGTGAFVVLNTGRKLHRVAGLLSSVAWSSKTQTRYLLEGTINSAGAVVDWLEKLGVPAEGRVAPLPDLDRLPVVVPAWAGLGAPHWVSSARGAILDLDATVSAADLHVAVLAGVGCRVREIFETMRRHRLRVQRIVTGGGLARSPQLLPLQASLLQRDLERSRVEEASARGAALLAGHAMGHWDLEKDASLRFPTDRISPRLPAAASRRYFRRFQRARLPIAHRGTET